MGEHAVMNIMMGWMKWMASWVLGLFNLAGGSGFSPLNWLSDNWVRLLVFFLIAGMALDILVWLLRWRPHWVWFHKKRIVINDDDFFAGEELVDSGLYDPSLFYNPEAERAAPQRPRAAAPAPQRRAPSTIVRPAPQDAPAPRKRKPLIERVEDDALEPRRPAKSAPRKRAQPQRKKPARAIEDDPLFSIDPARAIDPTSGEDAVFNVSDLPVSKDELAYRKKRK
ncbi:MAG: hypothetical protein ACOYI5_06910 [Christensenellales bacterium]|jgi:hypothetical protein